MMIVKGSGERGGGGGGGCEKDVRWGILKIDLNKDEISLKKGNVVFLKVMFILL